MIQKSLLFIVIMLSLGFAQQRKMELEDTIKSFDGLVKGEYDHLPETAFYMVGGIEEALEKAKKMEAEAA